MTREEAINELIINKDDDTYVIDDEALDMAIQALEQEPCEDAISRQAVLDLTWELNYPDSSTEEVVSVRDIKELTSVAPKEKIGHWIKMPKDAYDSSSAPHIYCSKCKAEPFGDIFHNYCPNCGCRMESKE